MPYYPPNNDRVIVALPDVVVSQTAVIAIGAGFRDVVVSCTGVIAGDSIQINPTTSIAGYAIAQAIATANNQLTVQVSAPLLAIGASYSMTCHVLAFR